MSYRPYDLDTAEKVIEAMARALATARADGRREGLEMILEVADKRAEKLHAEANLTMFSESAAARRCAFELDDLATAIRAMMEKEG